VATNLAEILETTRAGLAGLRSRAAELERAAAAAPAPPAFAAGFSGEQIGLVAEVKRRSPSAGVIRA